MLLLGSSSFRGITIVGMQIYFFSSAECELKLFGFANCLPVCGDRCPSFAFFINWSSILMNQSVIAASFSQGLLLPATT